MSETPFDFKITDESPIYDELQRQMWKEILDNQHRAFMAFVPQEQIIEMIMERFTIERKK